MFRGVQRCFEAFLLHLSCKKIFLSKALSFVLSGSESLLKILRPSLTFWAYLDVISLTASH